MTTGARTAPGQKRDAPAGAKTAPGQRMDAFAGMRTAPGQKRDAPAGAKTALGQRMDAFAGMKIVPGQLSTDIRRFAREANAAGFEGLAEAEDKRTKEKRTKRAVSDFGNRCSYFIGSFASHGTRTFCFLNGRTWSGKNRTAFQDGCQNLDILYCIWRRLEGIFAKDYKIGSIPGRICPLFFSSKLENAAVFVKLSRASWTVKASLGR